MNIKYLLLLLINFIFFFTLFLPECLCLAIHPSEGKPIYHYYNKSYALIIENENYVHLERNEIYESSKFKHSRKVKEYLLTLGFEEDNIDIIQDAKKSVFNSHFKKFTDQFKQETNIRLFFLYIGKSIALTDKNGEKKSFLVMTDSEPLETEVGGRVSDEQQQIFALKNINIIDFLTKAKTVTNGHVLFLFDCCIGFPSLEERKPIPLEDGFQHPILQFISSGGIYDETKDNILIENFIRCLDVKKKQKFITGDDIAIYLLDKIPNNDPQYRVYFPNLNKKGNFVFEKNYSKCLPYKKDKSALRIQTIPENAVVQILRYRKIGSKVRGKLVKEKYYHGIELKEGEYRIKVIKNNFETYRDWIKLERGCFLNKDIEIKPLGRLFVNTITEGARIRILNIKPKYKPGIQLESSEYDLEVTRKGYIEYFERIIIEPGKAKYIDVSLKPIPFGTLVVNTMPSNAEITLIDKKKRELKYKPGMRLNVDKYTLIVKKSGYKKYLETIIIEDKKERKVNISLTQIPKGRLYIQTIPNDSVIKIPDIKPVYTDGMLLNPGKYRIKVSKEGYTTVRTRVAIKSGKNTNATVKLVPKKVKVYINTIPKNSEIKIIDIRPKYKIGMKINPGKHHFQISKHGYKTYKEWLSINPVNDFHKTITLIPKKQKEKNKIHKTDFKYWEENKTMMKFVFVKGGCFDMGCKDDKNNCDKDETYIKNVCVDDFWIGTTEVTNNQFELFIKQSGINNFVIDKQKKNHPVINVSWELANEYAKWISKISDQNMRLPFEKEWEYACRSCGKQTIFSGGQNIKQFAWYKLNSNKKCHPVAQKNPNSVGVYDMSGNVWEWCFDLYYPNDKLKSKRIIRGGSWDTPMHNIRCTNRDAQSPDTKLSSLGFRLVRLKD